MAFILSTRLSMSLSIREQPSARNPLKVGRDSLAMSNGSTSQNMNFSSLKIRLEPVSSLVTKRKLRPFRTILPKRTLHRWCSNFLLVISQELNHLDACTISIPVYYKLREFWDVVRELLIEC